MHIKLKEFLAQSTKESIDGSYSSPYVDYQKFAELIIKECGKLADDNIFLKYCEDCSDTQYLLEQHFGIKE